MDPLKLWSAQQGDWLIFGISFLLACILSTWPGNLIVKAIYHRLLSAAPSPVAGQSIKSWLEARAPQPELAEFRSKTAAVIGVLERIIFIFGFMFAQAGLIAGVLVLKAFFAWTHLEAPTGPAPAPGRNAMLEAVAQYHTYIIGNLLSLLAALALGVAAIYGFPKLLVWLGMTCSICLATS
jgi:hypothetical protein